MLLVELPQLVGSLRVLPLVAAPRHVLQDGPGRAHRGPLQPERGVGSCAFASMSTCQVGRGRHATAGARRRGHTRTRACPRPARRRRRPRRPPSSAAAAWRPRRRAPVPQPTATGPLPPRSRPPCWGHAWDAWKPTAWVFRKLVPRRQRAHEHCGLPARIDEGRVRDGVGRELQLRDVHREQLQPAMDTKWAGEGVPSAAQACNHHIAARLALPVRAWPARRRPPRSTGASAG